MRTEKKRHPGINYLRNLITAYGYTNKLEVVINENSTIVALIDHLTTGFQPKQYISIKKTYYTKYYIAQESYNRKTDNIVLSIIEWKKMDDFTDVHGHSKLNIYIVLSGVYEMETFKNTPKGGLQLVEKRTLRTGDRYAVVENNTKNTNSIHRIKCITEDGVTVNIVSNTFECVSFTIE